MSTQFERRTSRGSLTVLYAYWVVVLFTAIQTSAADAIDQATRSNIETAKEAFFTGDLQRSLEILKPLTRQGDPEAIYYSALILRKQATSADEYTAVLVLLQEAAEKNHGPAMWEIGQAYENGHGVDRDLMSATDWYRRSRKHTQGRKMEITYLKEDSGELVEQPVAEMIKGLEDQALSGDIEAQFRLGKLYDDGLQVPEDYPKALNWYRVAAQNKHLHAAFMLGYLYCRGLGVAVDKVQANRWLTASKRGAACR